MDCPNAPFSHDLISSMAKQAGVSKMTFDIHRIADYFIVRGWVFVSGLIKNWPIKFLETYCPVRASKMQVL